jgi:hypothetical protein
MILIEVSVEVHIYLLKFATFRRNRKAVGRKQVRSFADGPATTREDGGNLSRSPMDEEMGIITSSHPSDAVYNGLALFRLFLWAVSCTFRPSTYPTDLRQIHSVGLSFQ